MATIDFQGIRYFKGEDFAPKALAKKLTLSARVVIHKTRDSPVIEVFQFDENGESTGYSTYKNRDVLLGYCEARLKFKTPFGFETF